MIDREKTIRNLETIGAWHTHHYEPFHYECAETIHNALELLKEQESVKPTVSVDTWICSKCGHRLESQDLIDDKENPQVLVHELYQYCPNCGRAVKWDD